MVQSLPQSDGFRILFNSPELSEVQRSGFHLFLKNGISEELSKISCIQLKHAQFSIEIVLDSQDFRLVAPENNYRDCIIKMKSYTSKLYVQTKILFKDKISGELIYQTQPEWVLLADLPMMTKRGHFVINGSPRVIVHQVGRSPGVYFKKILKIKKDVNNKARFYGDIIPRKGVWVRLQINKKGDIDLKLKKSKKVRAEMVQKCLELLEKEKSKSIPFKGNRVISNLNTESQHFVGISNYRFNLGMEKQSFVSKSQSRCYTKSSYQKLLQVQNKVLQSKHLLSKTKVNQSTWHTKANHLQNPFLNLGKDDNRFSDYDTCLKPNHTDISSIQSQKQLFFSPQTSFLTGLGTNNSFSSKTRQTQAFVIGSPLNKPETVIHSICFHAIPWLRAIKESSVRVQTIIMSNKKQCFLFGRSKQSFCLKSHTQTARTFNKAKLFESSLSNTKINLSLNDKAIKSHSLSALKQESLYLLDKPSFTLGSQMYGTKRSSFTKAEKEAFTNVYISFYKNDIQDIKERVSMSVGKISQDSIKEDSLNSRLSAVTKISTEPRSKFLRKISKKKIASKQDLSSNLEKVRDYLYQLFKRSDLYDLGDVGREKINTKFDISITETQLTALDIKETINWLSKLRAGKEEIDDIDHSQNRRVRTSSELIQAQFEVGVTRLRNLVTKKIRNGKIEQIRTLPFAFTNKTNAYQKYSVPMQKQRFYTHKLVDVKQSCTKATPLNATHLHMVYKSLPSTKLHFARSSGVQSIPSLYKVFLWLYASRTQPSRFDMDSFGKYQKPLLVSLGRLHFKGGSNCFIRRATLIDQFKVNLKNRRIFTSINPYCLTFKKKKKYYSAFSKSRFADQRLNLQCTKTDKHLQNKSLIHTEQLQKRSDNFFIYTQIKTGDSVDLTSQNLLNSQSSQLLALPKQKFWYKQTFFAQHFSVSELFSTKPINGALREFFSSSPLSQYMDQTNPLAEITHKRRISSLGVGGVSRESAGMAIRGIHPTHYGRICPIETPEGKNAGLVNSLAFYAKINNQGFIETPYYPVIKGQVQHELGFSFYSAEEESKNGLYIAPNDIKQSKSKLLASNISTIESIPVRVADNILDLFKKVTPYQVDCIGISPVQILSVATSLIPFLEHNDANRALMGSNMQRQAVSLMISERPVIGTGLEARVLAESGHLVQSKTSGFVSNVSAHKVVVERLFKNFVFARTLLSSNSFVPCKQGFDKAVIRTSFNKKSLLLHTGCKQNHINLYQNQDKALQKQSFCICVPKLRFGTPTKVDLFENKGHGLLEAVVLQRSSHLVSFFICSKKEDWSVRERTLAKNKPLPYLNLFKSEKSHGVIETLIAPTQKNFQGFCFTKNKFALSPVAHSISTFSRSNQETCLIQKPLVEEGDWVQKGDMISDSSAGQKGELSVGKNVLIAYIPWQGYNFEDAIVISDRLVKEQLYTSLHIERYTVIVNDFKDKVVDTNEWFTGDLPGVDSKKRSHLQKSGLPVIGTILKEGDILVGKIKYSKKKPATPHEKLVCDILGEHNFSVQNSSLYVPKGVHEARVLTYKIKKRFEKALKNNLRPAGAPKIVHIFLGEKRNIQVGDKMSGRHGNKGIVSTILPKQDMPYLADGSPIDILLNPLGVPSRMNVGQVFECLLGLASTYLHQNFKVTSFDEFYGIEASQSLVFLKLYQARLQSGQNWLFQVSFPGKTRLTDGRSGECLDQWITVGRAYMLKLIHMVNEKIHARAIGPYALVTQQPLKGRAHKGGQRLGEMEVWAVEGFGAAYILQELLTKKSDDSIGRKEVLKAMLPKSGTFLDSFDPFSQSVQTEPHLGLNNSSKKESRLYSEGEAFNVLGQPDIFKVLICELQALCLDVGVYSMRTESFQRQFLGALE